MKTCRKLILYILTITLVLGIGSAVIPTTSADASLKVVKKLPKSIAKTWYTSGESRGIPVTATTSFSKKTFKLSIKVGANKETTTFKIAKILKHSNNKYTIVSKKDGNLTFKLVTKKFKGKKYKVLAVDDESLTILFFTTATKAKATGYNFMQ
ncbi:hypothetical protein EQG49_03630 [Periweissella cryptocerci]|uniref:Uncharacterized protein n=1 Tax=Periweissella cryptocerci TaxID=2506420 RepID=A0A4P6YSL2_9LACO|nr:hypothetical protein [Periweissella cryptocerci]QBO35613.1 hypothetical protein EQG49_03630 [Periweissella cryptocerci]